MGNISSNSKGMYKGKSHAEGGIPVVVDGNTNVEIEGNEYHLCRDAMSSAKIYSFKNKSNKEILDSIYSSEGCKFVQGIANSGDFIVCKLVVLDDDKRTITGTVKSIIDTMQSEKSCNVSEGSNKMENGGNIPNSNIENFMNWYKDWYRGVDDKMNILISLPSIIAPFKEDNVVILDLFEKIDQNIDAKPYLKDIVDKADEYDVTIYLEPMPRYKFFLKNIEKRIKISKHYLISYYEKFDFKLTPNKIFMKRLPKDKMEKGGGINQCLSYIETNKKNILANGYYHYFRSLPILPDVYAQNTEPEYLNDLQFLLITYNSTNSLSLIKEIKKLLACSEGLAKTTVAKYLKSAKKFYESTFETYKDERIIIVNRDEIVCQNVVEQMEKGGGIPNNIDVVNGFYSPLEKIISETKFDKLPAKQWIEKFANGDEAKWTGLKDWLLQQQGSVSKADVQQYLKDNRIQIVEVVKSKEGYRDDWDRENDNKKDTTKFSQYQLEGEKENYKEVLVTMPKKYDSKYNFNEIQIKEEGNFWSFFDKDGELITAYSKRLNPTKEDATSTFKQNFRVERGGGFKSSHFNEPNILVHLRMNTRIDADGKKVLFLEEIQSDWGQKGKKAGFTQKESVIVVNGNVLVNNKVVATLKKIPFEIWMGKDLIERIKENPSNYRPLEFYKKQWEDDSTIRLLNEQTGERFTVSSEQEAIDYFDNGKGVPIAPFVTDTNAWTKLGLKVALKEAVKQGADKIAWTTGEQQNERYDLSKQVSEISYSKGINDTYNVWSYKDSREVFSKNAMSINEIESTFGKDIAKKIEDNIGENAENRVGKYKKLIGVDLKVGGKGMKGFYGSPIEGSLGIVGNVAKSLFKQVPKTTEIIKGDKVEYDQVDNGSWSVRTKEYTKYFTSQKEAKEFAFSFGKNKSTQYSIDITPELKESTEAGLPMFKKGGSIDEHKETYEKWKSLVNMSKSELKEFYDSQEGKDAGLSDKESNDLGISNGRESARWIMRMKDTTVSDWTPKMWEWANKQISFISRMSGNKGSLYDDNGNKTRKHTSLLIWGHNPEKMGNGGEIITYRNKFNKKYGFELNESHSLEEIAKLTSLKLSALQDIYNKGIGAYKTNPESVRPIVKSKEQWAMARVYSAVMGGKASKVDANELERGKMKNGGELAKGIKTEMEHKSTIDKFKRKGISDKEVAKSIAEDHLKEDSSYYSKLAKMEGKMEQGGNIPNYNMELLAPNGNKSNLNHEQWHLVRTPAFKKWFGDWEKLAMAKIKDSAMDEVTLANISKDVSKVVDENGEPLVVYHGTKHKFTSFDLKHFGKTDLGFFGQGFYFSTDKGTAEAYASISEWDKIQNTFNENGSVLQLFLNLKNPIIVKTKMDFINASGKREIREGYDGKIVIPNSRYSANTEYVTFNPNQIKLADGSNTTFDGNNDDIRYEYGGELKSKDEKKIKDAIRYVENSPKARMNIDFEDEENVQQAINDGKDYERIFPLKSKANSFIVKKIREGVKEKYNSFGTWNEKKKSYDYKYFKNERYGDKSKEYDTLQIATYDNEGKIVGVIRIATSENKKEEVKIGAFKISVRQDYQNKGIASKLIEKAESEGIDFVEALKNNNFTSKGRWYFISWLNKKLKKKKYSDGDDIEGNSKKNIEQHLSKETVDSFKQKLNNPFGKKVVINNIEYTIVDFANGFGSPDITLQDNNGNIYYTETKTFDGRTIKKLPTKSSLIEIIKKQDEIHTKANFLLNEIDTRHREKYNNEDIKTGLAKQYAETMKDRGEKRAISNLEFTLMNYIPTNVQSDYRNKILLKEYDKIDDSNDDELKFDSNYRPLFWHLTEKEFCDYAENYEIDTRLEGTKAKMECKDFYKYAVILPLLHKSAERNVFLLAVETGQLPYDKAVEIITNVGEWKETNKFVAELIRYDADRNFNANIWLQPKDIFLSSDYFKNNFTKAKADKWYSTYINDKIYNQSQELLIKFIESGIVTYADVVKRVNESNADVHPEDFAKIKIISKKAQTRLKLKALRLILDDGLVSREEKDKRYELTTKESENKVKEINEKREEISKIFTQNEKTIVQSIINETREGKLFNKSSLEKLGKEYGITNQNLVKELAELAVSFMARAIASNSDMSTKERYEKIVGLYKNQSNLSHRTSQSIMFQQYSTPAPIGYLAGLFCGFNKQGNYFEPSAGNGLLTTAGNPSNFIVNEIDDVRNRNLKVLGFSKVLKQDATNPFVGYEKSFDGIITNPPFGTTEGVAYGNTDIKSLEQLMCLRALDTMKDNGRGALIIGGHLEYDKAGRIKAGKNRSFFVYLYRNYNVLDVINIDGQALYSRQGTSFNVRLILIDGRKEIPNGYPLIMEEPLPVTETNSYTPVKSFETLWDRVNKSM